MKREVGFEQKRSRWEIYRDMLSTTPTNKTRLFYATNTSYKLFKRYLNDLLEREFLEITSNIRYRKRVVEIYQMTKAGKDFLSALNQMFTLWKGEPI